MKLGFITPQISRSMGGIQNTSYLMASTFSKENDFVAICACDSEDVSGENLKLVKSKYKQNQTIGLHINNIKNLFSNYKENRFDFTFATLYTYAIPNFLLKKVNKVQYGIMIHGNELFDGENPRNIFRKIGLSGKQLIRRILIENADIIFANSKYTKDLCESEFKCKKIVVIHPPIKYSDKKIDTQDSHKTYKLLSIGRLVERKGFQFVIQAMSKLVIDCPELKYYIAGSGPYSDKLQEKIVELGLKNNVFLLGRVSEEEKDKLYRECDYFIMPSYTIEKDSNVEGFGIVYIEANMYGKFVVATREGGITDAIKAGVTGDFVNQKDSDSIYMIIKKLYSENFNYDKYECIKWSKGLDIELISSQYLEHIARVIG